MMLGQGRSSTPTFTGRLWLLTLCAIGATLAGVVCSVRLSPKGSDAADLINLFSLAGMKARIIKEEKHASDWILEVQADGFSYICKADRGGNLVSIRRSGSAPMQRADDTAWMTFPREVARIRAHGIADKLIDQLKRNVRAVQVAESSRAPIVMDYVPMLFDFPVRGYGAILQFDEEGRLLAYDGNWNLPPGTWQPGRLKPFRMIWDAIDQGGNWPDELEVAWFEIGPKLELLTRARYGKYESFYRSGFALPAQRVHVSPPRYNADGASNCFRAPSTR